MFSSRDHWVMESASRPGWFIVRDWAGHHWTDDLNEATRWPKWNFEGEDINDAQRRWGGLAYPVEVDLTPTRVTPATAGHDGDAE